MPASYDRVDDIIVLIDINDPMTYDEEFVNRIRYSDAVIGFSDMNDAARKAIHSANDDDELTNDKFFFQVYTDRFPSFMVSLLHDIKYQRALIFRREHIDGENPDPDEVAEEEDATLFDLMKSRLCVQQIYELKTISIMPEFREVDSTEEPVNDEKQMMEDVEAQADDMVEASVKKGSFFVPVNKNVH